MLAAVKVRRVAQRQLQLLKARRSVFVAAQVEQIQTLVAAAGNQLVAVLGVALQGGRVAQGLMCQRLLVGRQDF